MLDGPAGAPVALGGDVFQIDTRMGGYDGIAAGFLIRSERPCLVETGTALSAPTVVEAVRSLGVDPDDLATLVVTHIHLDHAGGAGDIAAAFPRARVVVHESGARHLVEPDRLTASARRVFGAAMDTVFGPLAPTPAERLDAVAERGTVDLGGGRHLEAVHSPGHARHHLGLLDSATGDLYVGDAAGIYLGDIDTVRASTPPPDLDVPAALASLELFESMRPRRLLFSHFGPADRPDEVLGRAAEDVQVWLTMAREAFAAAPDEDHAVALVRQRAHERYTRLAADPEREARIEFLSSTEANLAGLRRWLERDPG